MNIQPNLSVNFQAKVSPRLLKQLYKQAGEAPKNRKMFEVVDSKLDLVKSWGKKDSEITICLNDNKNFSLGLSARVPDGRYIQRAFTGLRGKKEITQFLYMTEKNLMELEEKIFKVYKRERRLSGKFKPIKL